MGPLDILVLLSVTIGPTKAAAAFLSMTAGASPELKRQIAIRTVLTATIVCCVFVLFGQGLLGLFHISLPALLIAGGMILFVFALNLVLGEDHEEPVSDGPRTPSLDIASYPLAVPLIASPQGLVAIVSISVAKPGLGNTAMLLGLVLLMMAINAAVLLGADRIFARAKPAVMKVVMRIFGLLLCGLAVQLVIVGLERLGVLAAAH